MKRHCVVPLILASILATGLGSAQAAGNDSMKLVEVMLLEIIL